MLMDDKFEFDVPYVKYQIINKGKEFWEVKVPADLKINNINIYHWKVTDNVRMNWAGYPEILLEDVNNNNHKYWERIELISMGHVLGIHYFETKEKALEYKEWYLQQINKERRC